MTDPNEARAAEQPCPPPQAIFDNQGNPAVGACTRCGAPIFAAGPWTGPFPGGVMATCGCWHRGFTPPANLRPKV